MNGTASVSTGINGIRVQSGKLWFTNPAKGTLNWISIDSITAQKNGTATVVASGLLGPDDPSLIGGSKM
ncbi:hypothetical protein LTR04_004007, partial [Oleoguttula sp. CCFEE 6159]